MPQQAWSKKRERQYEHIKEGLEDRGTSDKKAEEIAARTVNKERARKGEAKTSSKLSRTDISSARRGVLRSGTNRAKGRTKEQLYNEAKHMGIEGRSQMTKAQLQRAVDRHKG
jgi:plasmid stabilization system protein ParE